MREAMPQVIGAAAVDCSTSAHAKRALRSRGREYNDYLALIPKRFHT